MARRALLILLCMSSVVFAETTRELWDRGAAAYQAGEIFKALAFWDQALAQDPANAAIIDKVKAVRAEMHLAEVVRVVDGDTVIVRLDGVEESVRLIGVDAPESVHPLEPVQAFSKEASDYLKGRIEGQAVALTYRGINQERDRYYRLLAYVYLLPGGDFINNQLVSEGYAHAYLDYPFAYMDVFRDAERGARDARKGLWAGDGTGESPPAEIGADNGVANGSIGAIQGASGHAGSTAMPDGFLVEGHAMVPVRAVLAWLGAQITFDAGRIAASRSGHAVAVRVDSVQAVANGQNVVLEAPPLVVEGVTYAPLRIVTEELGAYVEWDAAAATARILHEGRIATVRTVAIGDASPAVQTAVQRYVEQREAARLAAAEAAAEEERDRHGAEESGSSGAGSSGTARPAPDGGGEGRTVYITNTGEKYHAGGCRYVRKSKIPIGIDEARRRGYSACSVCGGG